MSLRPRLNGRTPVVLYGTERGSHGRGFCMPLLLAGTAPSRRLTPRRPAGLANMVHVKQLVRLLLICSIYLLLANASFLPSGPDTTLEPDYPPNEDARYEAQQDETAEDGEDFFKPLSPCEPTTQPEAHEIDIRLIAAKAKMSIDDARLHMEKQRAFGTFVRILEDHLPNHFAGSAMGRNPCDPATIWLKRFDLTPAPTPQPETTPTPTGGLLIGPTDGVRVASSTSSGAGVPPMPDRRYTTADSFFDVFVEVINADSDKHLQVFMKRMNATFDNKLPEIKFVKVKRSLADEEKRIEILTQYLNETYIPKIPWPQPDPYPEPPWRPSVDAAFRPGGLLLVTVPIPPCDPEKEACPQPCIPTAANPRCTPPPPWPCDAATRGFPCPSVKRETPCLGEGGETIDPILLDEGFFGQLLRRRSARRQDNLPPDELPHDFDFTGIMFEFAEVPVDDDLHARGGRKVYGNQYQCTSGFSVYRISDGVNGVASAGHCQGIDKFDAESPEPDFPLYHRAEHCGSHGDMEWKTSSHLEIAEYWANVYDKRDVRSVETSYSVNNWYCVYSRMQGKRTCDQVFSTSVSQAGCQGRTAYRLVAMDNNDCIPGDSGGPWSFGTEAAGLVKGWKQIWFGRRSTFTKATRLDNGLGVWIKTK